MQTKTSQHGFTLTEILIASLVLAIGMLGLAGLQLTSLRSNQSANYRTAATFLAYDMADRIRANPNEATKYVVDLGDGPVSGTNCEGNSCNTTAMANFDITSWKCSLGNYNDVTVCKDRGLRGILPQGNGNVVRNNRVYTVTVMWDDERLNPPNKECGINPKTHLTCLTVSFIPF